MTLHGGSCMGGLGVRVACVYEPLHRFRDERLLFAALTQSLGLGPRLQPNPRKNRVWQEPRQANR
jgi:hypothetical protein